MMLGTVAHVLTAQEGAACPAGVGRYFGPVVLPERQSVVTIEPGDATQVPMCFGANDTVIIAHGCNAQGKWGAGFSGALSRLYPEAEARYRAWAAGEIEGSPPLELGRVQLVAVTSRSTAGVMHVANMITQARVRRAPDDKVFSAEAFIQCIDRLSDLARSVNASAVIMPAIGTGLGGADWAVDVQPALMRLCARGLRVRVFAPRSGT